MENYFQTGYFSGNITNELLDYSEFQKYSNRVISLYDTQLYEFRWAVLDGDNSKDRCPVSEIQSILDKFKTNKFIQRWKEMPAGNIPDCNQYFENLSRRIISKKYIDFRPESFRFSSAFSLYENDDFIRAHRDGANPGRVCAVLIYLSDEKDYNDGGGSLILEDNGIYEKVTPVRGNYVLLDFTKHNLVHSVEKVKNNFKRFCFISFVSVEN